MKSANIKSVMLLSFILLQQAVFAQGKTGKDPGALAQHEFDYREQMAFKRLTGNSVVPVYTKEFILADVNIDPANPRRFYNFSGDLSGRYIEVLSMAKGAATKVDLPQLVKALITYQKPDGRFGDAGLTFREDQISGEHMALLWGNGRLLVGLMQYYKEYKDENALQAARKLGDFFISSYAVCSTPAVAKRLEGLMAMGIICFTQYIEGLVLLSEYSGDSKYAAVAAKTYKVLADRGKQHTHGYLSTLRGVLMLYHYDHKKEHLEFVRAAYDDMVRSDDYTAFGSVREYFGHMDVDRDEGCSTADFVRLGFDLYKATGHRDYFDKGEFGLLNALYFNQYYTGDFGHHVLTAGGSTPDFLHASWWCCTMHGLRAMYEVKKHYLAEEAGSGVKLNLYVETEYTGNKIAYVINKGQQKDQLHCYDIRIKSFQSGSEPLQLRVPEWAAKTAVWVNGKQAKTTTQEGYLSLDKIKAGDVIRIGFEYKLNIHTPEGKVIAVNQLTAAPVTGYLHYGPYLLGADDKLDATFTAEPNENIVYINPAQQAALPAGKAAAAADGYYNIRYKHNGFPSNLPGMLRPVSALTFDQHGYLMTKLIFASGEGDNTAFQKGAMLAPFDPNAKSTSEENKK